MAPAAPSGERTPLLAPGTWTLDTSGSQIDFSVSHMRFRRVRGHLRDGDGHIRSHPDGVAEIEASLPLAGLETGDRVRDDHVRELFAADEHPLMRYTARCEPAGPGEQLRACGGLSIRGTTRELELAVDGVERVGGDRAVVRASGAVSRRAYGLVWDAAVEAGELLVGDSVAVQLQIALALQQPAG